MKLILSFAFIFSLALSQLVENDSLVYLETGHVESKENQISAPGFNSEQDELSTSEIVFRNDVVVDSGQVISKNIRIIGADITVYGTVDGNITLYGGNAFLKRGAVLNGQLVTIGGYVTTEEGVTINGKIIESNLAEGLIYRKTDKDYVTGHSEFNLDRRSLRSSRSWVHPKKSLFVYNRNEGLVFTPFNAVWDRANMSNFRLNWSLGVRIHKGVKPDFVGRGTLEKTFFPNRNLLLYSSIFKESRTDDSYRLPRKENSLAGFLGRQDFYDRWNETGWEIGLGLDFLPKLRLNAKAVISDQDSLHLLNLWSLFERSRPLRKSLAVQSGQVNYYQITLASRTPNYTTLSSGAALFLQSEYMQAAGDTTSLLDMKFSELINRNLIIFIMNWEFSPGLIFRSRLLAGSAGQNLPSQRYFGVGGLGSVAAQPYKAQLGDRMAQANLELLITPEFTGNDWIVILFANGGNAWFQDDYDFDFDKIKTNGISSAGIGLGSSDHDDDLEWMINIAKPLDRSGPYETTIRINYNF